MLAGPPSLREQIPAGWQVGWAARGLQLVAGDRLTGTPDGGAVVLGAADVPDMLTLVARTQPGPFAQRTCELGSYLGIRQDGRLVAMAGERMRVPGHTEISAVCTDPGARGQGLAGRLVQAVVHSIRARGEVPFLHTAASNTAARRLYAALGFEHRRDTVFYGLRTPA